MLEAKKMYHLCNMATLISELDFTAVSVDQS